MIRSCWRTAGIVALCAMLVVSIAVLPGAAGGGATPHTEERWPAMPEGTTFQNFTMYLYGDSSHAPGVQNNDYWYEVVVHGLPDDDRRAWLNQSITATPWVSACGIQNLVHFGIDRRPPENGSGGGSSTYYQTETESHVTSVNTSYDQTWRGETGVEKYNYYMGLESNLDEKHWEFPLSSNGWDAEFVQTSQVIFWDKEEARQDDGNRKTGGRTTFEYENMDRVIVDYQDCLTNPSEAGWYRMASFAETYWVDQRDTAADDRRTGAPENQNFAPVTFSHWVYICECQSYDEAVDTLGAPPEMNGTKVANPGEFRGFYVEGGDTPTPSDGGQGTPTPTPGGTPTPTPGDTPTATATATPTATETAETETVTEGGSGGGGDTPTDASQPGFGAATALVALVVTALVARRRD